MCSPGETPNACTYITLSGLSFYFKMKGPFFNFKKSSCSHQKNFKAKPHLCLLSFPLKKPLFFTQEYLALEMVKVSDALLDLRRKYQQNRENQGRRFRKSHDWQRGFDYSVSLSPLTSEHTQAHSDSPSRSKDKSRMKAGFLSGDSWLPRHHSLFWSGLDPSRAGSLHGLRFAELPPRKQYGLKSRQLGSLNRKLSKALISCWGPAWGTPSVAKVMRKEARHTQRQDQASGVPLEILEHLPP